MSSTTQSKTADDNGANRASSKSDSQMEYENTQKAINALGSGSSLLRAPRSAKKQDAASMSPRYTPRPAVERSLRGKNKAVESQGSPADLNKASGTHGTGKGKNKAVVLEDSNSETSEDAFSLFSQSGTATSAFDGKKRDRKGKGKEPAESSRGKRKRSDSQHAPVLPSEAKAKKAKKGSTPSSDMSTSSGKKSLIVVLKVPSASLSGFQSPKAKTKGGPREKSSASSTGWMAPRRRYPVDRSNWKVPTVRGPERPQEKKEKESNMEFGRYKDSREKHNEKDIEGKDQTTQVQASTESPPRRTVEFGRARMRMVIASLREIWPDAEFE